MVSFGSWCCELRVLRVVVVFKELRSRGRGVVASCCSLRCCTIVRRKKQNTSIRPSICEGSRSSIDGTRATMVAGVRSIACVSRVLGQYRYVSRLASHHRRRRSRCSVRARRLVVVVRRRHDAARARLTATAGLSCGPSDLGQRGRARRLRIDLDRGVYSTRCIVDRSAARGLDERRHRTQTTTADDPAVDQRRAHQHLVAGG